MILKKYLDKNYTKEEQINLIYLNCSDEGITSFSCASLEGIEGLDKIKLLHCDRNKLTSLKEIEGLDKLEVLVCYGNNLTSLKEIEKLDKLEELYCFDNKLTSLKGIERLDKLKNLYCNDNPLPYSDLFNLDKIKLELKKEIRQDKIQKLLL